MYLSRSMMTGPRFLSALMTMKSGWFVIILMRLYCVLDRFEEGFVEFSMVFLCDLSVFWKVFILSST